MVHGGLNWQAGGVEEEHRGRFLDAGKLDMKIEGEAEAGDWLPASVLQGTAQRKKKEV